MRCVILDYGMGNTGSILNMLKRIGADAEISSDPSAAAKADKLILPGVGSFDQGKKNLEVSGLLPVLYQKVMMEKTPILGICLGMQLFTSSSEEGVLQGLGWLNAETVKFRALNSRKIPHMGWNILEKKKDHVLFSELGACSRFYFVHSYHVICREAGDILAVADYDGEEFIAAIQRENILGVQFHPEKSHRFGKTLLKNFIWEE